MSHDTEPIGGLHPGTSPTAEPSNDRNVSFGVKGVGAKPWIKMRTDLWDDPRVSALCDILKTNEAATIGGLYRLWSIADSHSTNGELCGMSAETLDRKSGIVGFASALKEVGWLIIANGKITIPDFDIHNGGSAKSRAQAALRQRSRRSKAVADNATEANSITQLSRNERDKNATRVEKSRTEKRRIPPSPTHSTLTEASDDEVEGVEVLLSQAGITTAGSATRLAVERGYTRNEISPLLDWLKSHPELGEGALVFRLKNSPPTTPVDQGWPASKTKPRDDGYARRLSQFGPILRGMSDRELRALCERAGLPESEWAHCRGLPISQRKLIEQLARENSSLPQRDKPP